MRAKRRAEEMITSARARLAMDEGILARLVDVEIMMGMLHGRDAQAARDEGSRMSFVSSVVLPAPLQPAIPRSFMRAPRAGGRRERRVHRRWPCAHPPDRNRS